MFWNERSGDISTWKSLQTGEGRGGGSGCQCLRPTPGEGGRPSASSPRARGAGFRELPRGKGSESRKEMGVLSAAK